MDNATKRTTDAEMAIILGRWIVEGTGPHGAAVAIGACASALGCLAVAAGVPRGPVVALLESAWDRAEARRVSLGKGWTP